jgi:c-di-GMP-binding flagellar brake protein YcgR
MTMMAEVRRDERVRAFLRARIIFNNQNTTVECTIKNISAHGAKIELSQALTVPSEFDLEVPQKGRTYRARMMWRDSSAIGVQFIEAEPEHNEAQDPRIARLQADNRRLKALVAALKKRLEDLGQDISEA